MKCKTVTVYWEDTKRWLGMPLTFTHYSLNSYSLSIVTGILGKVEEGCKLSQIEEVTCSRSFFQRLFGVGTVNVLYKTRDGAYENVYIRNVPNARDVRDLIEELSEEAILRHRYPYRSYPRLDQSDENALIAPHDIHAVLRS